MHMNHVLANTYYYLNHVAVYVIAYNSMVMCMHANM